MTTSVAGKGRGRQIGSKVAIVGSRGFSDLDAVRAYVRGLSSVDTVVSGGAVGVDAVAEDEARRLRVSRHIFEPERGAGWSRAQHVRALLLRNQAIARECDRMVAFWDGQSPGTQNVTEFARRIGRVVEIVRPR